jgi:hypothetical protein
VDLRLFAEDNLGSDRELQNVKKKSNERDVQHSWSRHSVVFFFDLGNVTVVKNNFTHCDSILRFNHCCSHCFSMGIETENENSREVPNNQDESPPFSDLERSGVDPICRFQHSFRMLNPCHIGNYLSALTSFAKAAARSKSRAAGRSGQ